jgi:hypothetical protein
MGIKKGGKAKPLSAKVSIEEWTESGSKDPVKSCAQRMRTLQHTRY